MRGGWTSLCARAQLMVCDSPLGRLGLSVCYDLRFPEVYQQLVFERGAEVLLVPSAFTVKTGAFVSVSWLDQRACFHGVLRLSAVGPGVLEGGSVPGAWKSPGSPCRGGCRSCRSAHGQEGCMDACYHIYIYICMYYYYYDVYG